VTEPASPRLLPGTAVAAGVATTLAGLVVIGAGATGWWRHLQDEGYQGLARGPLALAIVGAIVSVVVGGLVAWLARGRADALAGLGDSAQQLRASEERLAALVEHSVDLVAIVDGELIVTFVNPAVERLFGRSAAQLLGQRAVDVLTIPEASLVRSLVRSTAPGAVVTEEVVLLAAGDREVRYVLTVTNLLHDPAVRGYVLNGHDITDRHAYEQLLMREARHDPLTGLPNRAQLRDILAAARAAARDEGTTFSVLYLDLDRFKVINDIYGHDVGDAVLQVLAGRVRRVLRASDTAVRVGGDELVVVCPGAGAEAAAALAGRLTDAITVPVQVGNHEVLVGASVGVAVGDGTEPALDELVRRADQAMYHVKDAGRA